jgi:small subunit ribosomal protein S6
MPEQTEETSPDQSKDPRPAVAKPGTRPDRSAWLREYETIYLLPSDIADEAADKLAERLRELVGKSGGRVVKFITWGRRKTAFDVRRQPRALYVQMSYLGLGQTVSEVERNLRNMEEVEKFITTQVQSLVDPAARPTEPDVKLSTEVEEQPRRPDRSEGEGADPDLSDDAIPNLNAIE